MSSPLIFESVIAASRCTSSAARRNGGPGPVTSQVNRPHGGILPRPLAGCSQTRGGGTSGRRVRLSGTSALAAIASASSGRRSPISAAGAGVPMVMHDAIEAQFSGCARWSHSCSRSAPAEAAAAAVPCPIPTCDIPAGSAETPRIVDCPAPSAPCAVAHGSTTAARFPWSSASPMAKVTTRRRSDTGREAVGGRETVESIEGRTWPRPSYKYCPGRAVRVRVAAMSGITRQPRDRCG